MFELRAEMLDSYDDSGNEIVETFRIIPRSSAGLRESLQSAEGSKDATDAKR